MTICELSYLVGVRILSVSSISHLFHAVKGQRQADDEHKAGNEGRHRRVGENTVIMMIMSLRSLRCPREEWVGSLSSSSFSWGQEREEVEEDWVGWRAGWCLEGPHVRGCPHLSPNTTNRSGCVIRRRDTKLYHRSPAHPRKYHRAHYHAIT